MATSLTSTGVTFPDSTTQTTAATSAGGTLEAVASGALSTGDMVVVNTDGTVSVVAGSAETSGTPVVFESAATNYTAVVYDSTNNKIVIAYQDNANSSNGTAVVGTVSGTSISFGTPVVFESSTTTYISAAAIGSGKVVIAYKTSNTGYPTAIVGTVSGTSISFGSSANVSAVNGYFMSVVWDSANSAVVVGYRDTTNSGAGTACAGTVSGTSLSFGSPATFHTGGDADYISLVYDSTNQKVVAAFSDTTNANYGTAAVGTVSGTSISFGSKVVFKSSSSQWIAPAFDSTNGKVVISFSDGGSSNGATVVGTVSGTSISFGSSVLFNTGGASYVSSTYDSNAGKITVAFRDDGNSNYGTIIAGAVSGTTINFDPEYVFTTGSTLYTAQGFNSTANKIVVAYRDNSNLSYGTSVVYQSGSTNLTAENFVGVSDGNYSDTDTATILIAGSVSDAQSGLTAGQSYYVQTDGTLSTTPDDPSVFAGTSISSTKLIVQG